MRLSLLSSDQCSNLLHTETSPRGRFQLLRAFQKLHTMLQLTNLKLSSWDIARTMKKPRILFFGILDCYISPTLPCMKRRTRIGGCILCFASMAMRLYGAPILCLTLLYKAFCQCASDLRTPLAPKLDFYCISLLNTA